MTTDTVTTPAGVPSVATPDRVDAALTRVRAEQRRVARLMAGAPQCRRLSALYEHEARLWTLLTRHTPPGIYQRAAIEADCTARARARDYAELARAWTQHAVEPDDEGPTEHAP